MACPLSFTSASTELGAGEIPGLYLYFANQHVGSNTKGYDPAKNVCNPHDSWCFVVNKAKLAMADAGNMLVKGQKKKKIKTRVFDYFVFQQPLLMTRILMVDDDRTLSPLVKEYLEAKGFSCDLSTMHLKVLNHLKAILWSLYPDVRMPLKTGFELASEMKLLQPEIPFFISHRWDWKGKENTGIGIGADDYITKPFSMQELHLQRVQAILRRVEAPPVKGVRPQIYQIGGYEFNASTRELKNDVRFNE